MGKVKQTLEGAMFLPGVMYNGGADLSAPLIPLSSLEAMLSIYHDGTIRHIMPLMDEFGAYAAEYGVIDHTLKHLYAPVTLFHRHKRSVLSEMLAIMALKYGWFDIPDDLLVRTEQYLVAYSEGLAEVNSNRYYREQHLESATHVHMLKMYQHTRKNMWEHMRYVASALYHKLTTYPKLTIKQMLHQNNTDEKYVDIAAEFVKVSLILHKCNVKVPLDQVFVNSPMFKAAMAMMADYVVGPKMMYKNPIGALEKTWECKLPTIMPADVNQLRPKSVNYDRMCLLTIDPSVQPTFAVAPIEGINPRLMDFNDRFNVDVDRIGSTWAHLWYIGGISTVPGIENDTAVREYVAKILCSAWRMDKLHGRDTMRLCGHIARVFRLNVDDILGAYYRLSMSNIGWAYTRMPELLSHGMAMGPRIENVTSKAIIRKLQTGVSMYVQKVAKMMIEGIPEDRPEDDNMKEW